MKRTATITLGFAALLAFASCTPDKPKEEELVTEEQVDTAIAASDSTLTEEKQELMQTIAQHSMLQVELGKLATQKGVTDAVKNYGREMTDRYTAKQTELQEVANTYNITLPTALNDDHKKYLEDLQKEKDVDFDRKYWETVTDVQKKTLDAYDDGLKDEPAMGISGFGIWARTAEKELQAQMEQALARQLELKNRT